MTIIWEHKREQKQKKVHHFDIDQQLLVMPVYPIEAASYVNFLSIVSYTTNPLLINFAH